MRRQRAQNGAIKKIEAVSTVFGKLDPAVQSMFVVASSEFLSSKQLDW